MAAAAAPGLSGPALVRLTIPAKAEYITLCRLALTGLARTGALSDEDLADTKLALSEACSNAVRHGYRDGRDGVIDILYELDAEHLAIVVSDNGTGFEPEELREDTENEGGLGIAIIRAVTDELELGSRQSGSGAELRFVKRLSR